MVEIVIEVDNRRGGTVNRNRSSGIEVVVEEET